jgi:hypothetical protein
MLKSNGFLNVDLEVGADKRAQLAPLLDAFDGKLLELFRGRLFGLYRAHFECNGRVTDASSTIRELVAVIDGLNPAARTAWDQATMRDFNVGIELAHGVKSVELAIDPDTVRHVAALGARIVVTAYQVAAIPVISKKTAGVRIGRRASARDRQA